jgi:hypothetical protein
LSEKEILKFSRYIIQVQTDYRLREHQERTDSGEKAQRLKRRCSDWRDRFIVTDWFLDALPE